MNFQQIISVNLPQVLISLCNLLVLTLIVKHFLYKPVKKVFAARQAHVDQIYADAEEARRTAESDRATWAERVSVARDEADGIIAKATENARRSGEIIVEDAHARAEGIVRQAEEEALLARRKAEEGMRHELAGVSTELAEKLLGREINEKDHRRLIDSFIEELGENHDADQ